MAKVSRWYFPVRSDVEAPYPLFIGEMNGNRLRGSLDYLNSLRDQGCRVEFFTLPNGADVTAVYDKRGSIWECWEIVT